jgi:SAM-dependent methyltransferase
VKWLVTDSRKAHWEGVYGTKLPTQVSWYQPAAAWSFELVRATGVARSAPILDVGGGASPLVDHLLGDGYTDVTVLDVAGSALAHARSRLGDAAGRVDWLEADITQFRPTRDYALWHDRAVFHFLVDAGDRSRYLDVLRGALRPGGHVVLATFGPEGPARCSGLPVQRYSVQDIAALLGPGFVLRRQQVEIHHTPAGLPQQFVYGWWQAGS